MLTLQKERELVGLNSKKPNKWSRIQKWGNGDVGVKLQDPLKRIEVFAGRQIKNREDNIDNKGVKSECGEWCEQVEEISGKKRAKRGGTHVRDQEVQGISNEGWT